MGMSSYIHTQTHTHTYIHTYSPSRSTSKAAMCSWAISTMKRRPRKPLMMTDGCTQETLEKLKLVYSSTIFFSNKMHDPVLCKKFNSGNSWVDPTQCKLPLPVINFEVLQFSAIPGIKPLTCPNQFILWQQRVPRTISRRKSYPINVLLWSL